MNARTVAGAALVASLALACTDRERRAAPSPSPELPATVDATPTPTPTPSCPPLIETRPSLPIGVPLDLPWPSGAIVEGVDRDGRTVAVRMRVRRPIADMLAYAQKRLADEGYAFEGGALEGEVADVPFVKGKVRGRVDLRLAGPCDTRFTIAVGL